MIRVFSYALIWTSLNLSLSRGQGMDGHDYALSAPYALKAAVPLLLLPGALKEPALLPFEALMLGAFTLPNAMTLYNVFTADAQRTRQWRRTAFWCDAGMAAVSAGLGAYLIASSRGGDASSEKKDSRREAGTAILGLYTLPLIGFSLVDRLPFHVETRDPALPSLSLKAVPPDPGAGENRPALLATSDWFLSTPYALKAAAPLFMIPAAFMDPDLTPAAAALLAGVSLPNFMVVRNLYHGNAAGTRWWRRAVSWSELGAGVVLAGVGAYYILARPGSGEIERGWDPLIGALVITVYAAPLIGLSVFDRIPFKLEKHPARFSLGLRPPAPGSGSRTPGVDLRLHIPI